MPRAKTQQTGRMGWIGRDMVGDAKSARRRRLVPILVAGSLIAGLGIAGLRVDLIRVRYGLADALHEEKVLLEQQRSVRARVRALRDPARLAKLAERYGLERPEQIIDLKPGGVTVADAAPSNDAARGRP